MPPKKGIVMLKIITKNLQFLKAIKSGNALFSLTGKDVYSKTNQILN